MNIYYYTHTGHRFGLARFRKAVAIINSLPELDITLLTSDYRIASSSKEFGIKKAIGIDVLRNIPNVAIHGDILIYDSDEHNEAQLTDMIGFFSKFIRLSTFENDFIRKGEFLINPYIPNSDFSLQALPINETFFGDFQKKISTTLFFGDDDYDKDLLEYSKEFKNFSADLLLGFYYFFGYEDELKFFKKYHETEDYDEIIKSSEVVITSSYQTALEVLASSGKPIFVERADRDNSMNSALRKFNIPILESYNSEQIAKQLSENVEYLKIENQKESIRNFILKIIN